MRKNSSSLPLLTRLGVILSLLIPPSHVILPHILCSSHTEIHSLPAEHHNVVPPSPPDLFYLSFSQFPPPLLGPLNYLLFTRSQLKYCLVQEEPPSIKVYVTCPSGADITPGAPILLALYHYRIYLFTLRCTLCLHPLPQSL